MKELPNRKRNRLKDYDYSLPGAYFITICTKNKEKFFEVVEATSGRQQQNCSLSEYGIIVEEEIHNITKVYGKMIKVDKYVIMPNHIHLIIIIEDGRPKVSPTISRIIQQFKGAVTKKAGLCLWQSSFHDHIIRNYKDYCKIWSYIDTNYIKWSSDCFYMP